MRANPGRAKSLAWAVLAAGVTLCCLAGGGWAKPAVRPTAPSEATRVRFGFVDATRIQAEAPGLQLARRRIEAEQYRYDQELREGQRRIAAIEADIASADALVASLSAEATADPAVRQKAFAEREALDDRKFALADEVGALMASRRQALDDARRALEDEVVRIRGALAELARGRRLEGVLDGRHAFYGAVDLTSEVLRRLGSTLSGPTPMPSPAPAATQGISP
ncbi:MAG: OmpH family outer membrane protein [Candidatus Sericytochromatia bacterium]|nr:OmpH family outer membrane protein [Candidatus Sericytochromatia bacterium]